MGNILKFNHVKKAKPFSRKERADLHAKLHEWRTLIDQGNLDQAEALLPQLTKCKGRWEERDLNYLYTLFNAGYHLAKGDHDVYNEIMSDLENNTAEFCDEHLHFYFRLLGSREMEKRNFKEALKLFYKAEAEDRAHEWADVGFLYNIAYCLSHIDNTKKATQYLEMAMELAEEKKIRVHDIYIQCLLAINHSKLGQFDEAFKLVNNCLFIEKFKKNTDASMGYIYLTVGRIYYLYKDYSNSITYIDIAAKYFTDGSKQYMRCLYAKAQTLFALGNKKEGLAHVNKALKKIDSRTEWGATREALLTALKYSVSLSNPMAMQHLVSEAIPKLQELEQYAEVVEYYEKICRFYEEVGDNRQALKYSKLVAQVYAEYIENRVACAV